MAAIWGDCDMRNLSVGLTMLMLATAGSAQSAPKPEWGSFGVDTASADKSIKPGDDFWSHVNGTWARTAEIPADRGSLSQVQRLNDLAQARSRQS